MSVVGIFSGDFCPGREMARSLARALDFPLFDDNFLLEQAGWTSPAPGDLRARDLFERPEAFQDHPGHGERLLARLRLAMARLLGRGDLVYLGYATHLIPASVSHALSVCLIAGNRYRVAQAGQAWGLAPDQAEARIRQADADAQAWVGALHGRPAWSSDLYDMLIPLDKQDLTQAMKLILEYARSALLLPTSDSLQALEDFRLAAQAEVALADHGLPTAHMRLEASQGCLDIKTPGALAMTDEQEQDIIRLACQVDGVRQARLGRETEGPGLLVQAADAGMPSKIFLVDDEREYVQTLSERLLMRSINSVVAYDGEQALKLAAENEPEVMVLDLKMPGVDGLEVLRRVKKEHPATQVIILTGHGSESERQLCLELGAFAFLKKPVDMETLQQTMRQAYESLKAQRG